MTYKLYSYFRSSASFRVRIALNLKQIDYELLPIHLRRAEHQSPDYRNRNPQGLVPALECDGKHLAQSLAIIEYIDTLVPTPPLLPEEPFSRAVVRSMSQNIACDMHPLCNLRVLKYLRTTLEHDDDAIMRWYQHWMAEGFEGLELMFEQYSDGAYCFGAELSLADVCLVPQVNNARRFGFDLKPYPVTSRITESLEQHPAFIAARPEQQPDAED
jgi:maleylacetoacetate isomerase